MINKKLERLVQLNFELMETLELCLYRTQDFCKKNKIPFSDLALSVLLNKATRVIDEIDPIPYSHVPLADEKKHLFKTDEEVTEPQATA